MKPIMNGNRHMKPAVCPQEQIRGRMKVGSASSSAKLPLFGQHLMKVGNHGNRRIHKSQLKRRLH